MTEDGFTAGEVARQLGIAVTTVRTWHQRYGLGPSRHLPRQHRRYADEDVLRLEVMRRLTGQGVPAAEAARIAMTPTLAEPAAVVRDGGGHTIAVGRAGPAARGLARAAMRLDSPTMVEEIAAGIRDHGVVSTWEHMLRPVLIGIGERHATTHRLIEVEHLLSRSISEAFAAIPRPARGASPRTLLTCADEEQHTLPIEALAAALAEHGCGSRLLGARVPLAALMETVRRTGPTTVIIWSHDSSTGNPDQLRALLTARPRPVLIAAAGPGWPVDQIPAGVERPTHLGEALDLTLPIAAREI